MDETSKMKSFLASFKENLEKEFDTTLDNANDILSFGGTVGWSYALVTASTEYYPEIWALWSDLDWWASDLFDGWLVDCMVFAGLCKDDDSEDLDDLDGADSWDQWDEGEEGGYLDDLSDDSEEDW